MDCCFSEVVVFASTHSAFCLLLNIFPLRVSRSPGSPGKLHFRVTSVYAQSRSAWTRGLRLLVDIGMSSLPSSAPWETSLEGLSSRGCWRPTAPSLAQGCLEEKNDFVIAWSALTSSKAQIPGNPYKSWGTSGKIASLQS